MAGDGPALDFEQADIALGKNVQRTLQRAGFVFEMHDERKLVGALARLRRSGEQQEARVVFAMVLQVFEQNISAVNFRGALSGDGRARRIVGGEDSRARLILVT